ncbi:MAG: hypothetical protein H7Y04_14740 [Verrucomicrobia bacterium]|nr:hypothetical protein [Cytophagales bacterium]
MTIQYFIITFLSFATTVWVFVITLRKSYFPPKNNNNDDEGGTPIDTNLPVYDPPSGRGLDDLLVDRPPRDWQPKPAKPVET